MAALADAGLVACRPVRCFLCALLYGLVFNRSYFTPANHGRTFIHLKMYCSLLTHTLHIIIYSHSRSIYQHKIICTVAFPNNYHHIQTNNYRSNIWITRTLISLLQGMKYFAISKKAWKSTVTKGFIHLTYLIQHLFAMFSPGVATMLSSQRSSTSWYDTAARSIHQQFIKTSVAVLLLFFLQVT